MARIRNITPDTRSLFHMDAPPVTPDDEVTVRDENFVDRAWPKSTWDLVEPPELEGYVDQSTDDAWLYVAAPFQPDAATGPIGDPADFTVADVVAYLAQVDETERARIIAAEAAGKARKGITDWSE